MCFFLCYHPGFRVRRGEVLSLFSQEQIRKFWQKALFTFSMVLGWIGAFLGFLWAEEMSWWARVAWMTAITLALGGATYGVYCWVDSIPR